MSEDACIKLVLFFICAYLVIVYVEGGFTTTNNGPKPLWNATYTDKLRQDLLVNYDKYARPSPHQNATEVRLGLEILHVELNEFKSTLTVSGYTRLLWKDGKLKWNESDYGGINRIHMADHEIWQPDISLMNSAGNTLMNYYNTRCILYSNGEVLYVPPSQYTFLCDLNLKYWPFDAQTCKMLLASWTHHGDEIDLKLYNNDVNVSASERSINSTEWIIEGSFIELESRKYPCCNEPYPLITITINLIRRSPSYKALIVTPAFVVIALILSTFWLPPQAGEKIILNGCTGIIITLFLLYFTQKIPAMGSHTPLIVFFYSSCLWIIGFSIIGSVIVIWLSRSHHNEPLPWIIKQPLIGRFGRCLRLTTYVEQSEHLNNLEEMRDHQVTDFEENGLNDDKQFMACKNKTNFQNDWILLAVAIDRISFIFYSFLCLILSFSYSI